MTSTAKYKTSAPNKPKSCWDLFCSFTLMAMQAFGGSTAIAQQFLVDQKKWLTQSEFLDLLTVSQVLPGPKHHDFDHRGGRPTFRMERAHLPLSSA